MWKNIVCDSTSARVMLASKARTRTMARNKQMQSSRESIEYCFVHVLEEREGGEGERGGGVRCRLSTLPKAPTFTQGINFSWLTGDLAAPRMDLLFQPKLMVTVCPFQKMWWCKLLLLPSRARTHLWVYSASIYICKCIYVNGTPSRLCVYPRPWVRLCL